MKQNLNEQIARIKELLNEYSVINESEIDEQFAQFVKKIIPSLEKKIVTSIESKLGKKLATATDAEIGVALKSAELSALRKEIAQAVYSAEKTMIDDVFSKYNMSAAGEASAAYKELQAKGLNKSILRDVASEWKLGKSTTTASPTTSSSVASSSTAATTASISMDIEKHISKYFPNIASDRNIFNSLVNDIKKNISNLDTKGQIDFITRKCNDLEKQIGENLKNLTNSESVESAEAMKKSLNILRVIKEKLKKYGPLSYSKTDTVKFWASIPRILGWVAAMDILVGGAVESRKTGENLADTMFKRAGDRGAYVLGLFVSGLDKMIGSTPKNNTEPEKEKIEY